MKIRKDLRQTAAPSRGFLSRVDSGRTAAVLLVAIVLAAAAVGAWLYWRPRPPPAYVPAAVKPEAFAPAAAVVPTHIKLVDVTEAWGLRFRHHNGARGKKLLPETMGGGCAVLDFDRDGDQDLLLTNSCAWPGDEAEGAQPTQALYANDGTGKLTDVTAATGLALTFYGMGAAIGDHDGDGWDDIFFTGVGGERLMRNREGKVFEDISRAAGLADEGPHTWSSGAAFLDFDNDGKLDVFVLRYIEWSPQADLAQAFQITGLGRAYGPPMNFPGTHPRLYRNTGGKLEDVSARAGIASVKTPTGQPLGKGLGAAVYDLDEDGWVDIAVANDTVKNFLFHNRRDGTFAEIGEQGFAFDDNGKTRGAMGIDCADLDSEGIKGIVVGNFANEITALYRALGAGSLYFSDDAQAQGIGNPSRKYMKFGVFFFDLDLDGRPDIFEANGHLESEIEQVQAEQTYAQAAQIFWNAGPAAARGFEVLTARELGPDVFQPVVGRGCAYADFDGDGDLDIVLAANGGPARLFRNDGGNRNGWVRVKLVGKPGNTNAFGARVTCKVNGVFLRAQLASGRSYLSQCEQVITFGLGSAAQADEVKVFWPGQTTPVEIGVLPSGAVKEVRQP